MASYQDIETRLRVIERKMELVMQAVIVTLQVGNPLDILTPAKQIQMNLGQLYGEMQRAGGLLIDASDKGRGEEVVGDQSDHVGAGGYKAPAGEVIDAEFTSVGSAGADSPSHGDSTVESAV